MHIFGKYKTLRQALSDISTFTLGPGLDTSCHEKGLIPEPEDSLLAHFWVGRGRYIGLNLHG